MYEPSRTQQQAADEMAEKYGRSGVTRFPDSTNVLIAGYVEGEHAPGEQVLVMEDGARIDPFRPAKLYPGVFGVYQGRVLVTDSQVTSLVEARDAADEMNASYA
jgi:hypothetical protein